MTPAKEQELLVMAAVAGCDAIGDSFHDDYLVFLETALEVWTEAHKPAEPSKVLPLKNVSVRSETQEYVSMVSGNTVPYTNYAAEWDGRLPTNGVMYQSRTVYGKTSDDAIRLLREVLKEDGWDLQ